MALFGAASKRTVRLSTFLKALRDFEDSRQACFVQSEDSNRSTPQRLQSFDLAPTTSWLLFTFFSNTTWTWCA